MSSTVPPAVPFDDAYWRDPDAVMGALARQAPVHHRTLRNGVRVWVIPRHEDGRAVLHDPTRFAKDLHGIGPIVARQLAEAGHETPPHAMFDQSPVFSEGDQLKRLRGALAGAFTPARIAALRSRVRELVAMRIEHLAAVEGPVDLVAELAFPLPLQVLSELMGLPQVHFEDLRRWTRALMREIPEEAAVASAQMSRYVQTMIKSKRQDFEDGFGADDLLTSMITAQVDGARLSPDELHGTAFMLLVAGHETTMNSIANGIADLLDVPDRWRALVDDADLIPAAVKEVLRYRSTTRHSTYRYTTVPVTIGEVTIPAGELVLVAVHAANRDPHVFANPDEFRLDRPVEEVRAILSFGTGPHRCMGAQVAQMEITETLAQLTARFPHARLAAPLADQPWDESPVMLGRPALSVILTP